jgi:hypothetical protein
MQERQFKRAIAIESPRKVGCLPYLLPRSPAKRQNGEAGCDLSIAG